jgi:hypothetical protein
MNAASICEACREVILMMNDAFAYPVIRFDATSAMLVAFRTSALLIGALRKGGRRGEIGLSPGYRSY